MTQTYLNTLNNEIKKTRKVYTVTVSQLNGD